MVMIQKTKERPILFSGEMVRAILDGRKTQTRRAMKPQPSPGFLARGVVGVVPQWPHQDGVRWFMADGMSELVKCRYGGPGDRLWVRETWRPWWDEDPPAGTGLWACIQYKDGAVYKPGTSKVIPDIQDENEGHKFFHQCDAAPNIKWRSPRYMPRWASRLTLNITGVRVERLQHISLSDCAAEGAPPTHSDIENVWDSTDTYAELWDTINGPGAWEANPWVWVIEFKREAV